MGLFNLNSNTESFYQSSQGGKAHPQKLHIKSYHIFQLRCLKFLGVPGITKLSIGHISWKGKFSTAFSVM